MKKQLSFFFIFIYFILSGFSGSQDIQITRTKKEVLSLIKKAGQSKPKWWNSVSIKYPKTLDLSFKRPPKGSHWNTRKNVGQYIWSIINENSSKFKEGTKFIHFAMSTNVSKKAKKKYMKQLAHCYHDLLQDWARGAYWYQKVKRPNKISLANCYFQLGNKEMAINVLKNVKKDKTRYGAYIKFWSDIGELDRAVALAEVSAKKSKDGHAYRAIADAYRKHANYAKAIEFYNKVLALPKRNSTLKRNQQHSKDSLHNIKFFETFNLAKIKDGIYKGSCQGYSGIVKIKVEVSARKIHSIKVTSHKEKQYYSSITDMPKKMIKQQSIKVDATTGATVTANAIINATAKALNQGVK